MMLDPLMKGFVMKVIRFAKTDRTPLLHPLQLSDSSLSEDRGNQLSLDLALGIHGLLVLHQKTVDCWW